MIYCKHNAIYHSYKNLIIVFIHFWVCGMNAFAIVNMKCLVIYVDSFYYLWLYFFFQILHVKLEYNNCLRCLFWFEIISLKLHWNIEILYVWKLSMLYIYYKPYGTKIRYTLWSQGMKSWIFISVWLKFNLDGEPPLSFYFFFLIWKITKFAGVCNAGQYGIWYKKKKKFFYFQVIAF